MPSSRNAVLCLIHIERCGGTSLGRVLRANYPLYLTLTPFMRPHDEGHVATASELRWLFTAFPFVDAFGGHCTRTYLDYEGAIGKPVHYVTFLRDPVARYLSHFNHQVHAMSQRWTLESFMADRHFANFMTVRLAGREDLDEAKRRLAEDFTFFGLSEHFDESLVLMRDALGRPDMVLSYERQNTATNAGYRKSSLDDAAREAIAEQNALDLELYAFAKELYAERRAASTLDLEAEVEALRRGRPRELTPPERHATTALRWLGYKPLEAVLRSAYHPHTTNDVLARVQYRLKARLRDLGLSVSERG